MVDYQSLYAAYQFVYFRGDGLPVFILPLRIPTYQIAYRAYQSTYPWPLQSPVCM